MNHSALRLFALTGILIFLAGFCGCAPTTRIRASEQLLIENPMKKIVVLGYSKIDWPYPGNGGSVLGVSDSKQALDTHLLNTKTVLTNKGYQVICADPVGVGYSCSGWHVLPEDKEEKSTERMSEDETENIEDETENIIDETAEIETEDTQEDKIDQWIKIEDKQPVFVYDTFQTDDAHVQAIQRIILQVEAAISSNELNSFKPVKEDMILVGEAMGADTLCLDRVYGRKYTSGRKVGAALLNGFLGALTGVYASTNVVDTMEDFYIFIDTASGNVIWQHGMYVQSDPLSPTMDYTEKVLRYLPSAGLPFDSKACKKGDDGLINCK